MKILLFIIGIFFSFTLTAQNREYAFSVNEKLGRGINYGNMFEAPTENGWGNPWQPEYASIIAELGFNHVRIPIRWEPADRSLAISPYTIKTSFLNRIKQVVDSALNNGLFVIINMHHHDLLYENPDDQRSRFLAQWSQISDFFKDYPDSLLFEILNEPHGNLTASKWNIFLAEALTEIRKENPERIVLVGTPNYGGLGGLPLLQIPDDENIILTVHYYNPFQFTHQGASWAGENANDWLGTEWKDSEDERNIMIQEFAPLKNLETQLKIPVHIGEFGAYSAADMTSRAKWTTFLTRYFEQLGWSWAYWEFSAGFGIYNPDLKIWNQPLVDALLHNEMPEAAHYEGSLIYTSDFSQSNDGWRLFTQTTGSGQLNNVNNSLQVIIDDGGTQGWHVQIIKSNFMLENGKKYRLTFKASAEESRNISFYVGMNESPWSSYSGYSSSVLTETLSEFTVVFDMNTTTSTARIAFDLGKSVSGVTITEIKLEEINLVTTKTELDNFSPHKIYPNPVVNTLFIENIKSISEASFFNLQGQLIFKQKMHPNQNEIDVRNLKAGIYLIKVGNEQKMLTKKIIKIE